MTAPFEMAVSPASIVAVSANVALKAGSSNEGNMRRASVASSCVTGVTAVVRLAQIEAAQLAVENSAIGDVDLRGAGAGRLVNREGGLLPGRVERDLCGLRAAGRGDRHRLELDLGGVEDDLS